MIQLEIFMRSANVTRRLIIYITRPNLHLRPVNLTFLLSPSPPVPSPETAASSSPQALLWQNPNAPEPHSVR